VESKCQALEKKLQELVSIKERELATVEHKEKKLDDKLQTLEESGFATSMEQLSMIYTSLFYLLCLKILFILICVLVIHKLLFLLYCSTSLVGIIKILYTISR